MTEQSRNHLADAIMETLVSDVVANNNGDPSNIVDVIGSLSTSATRIADAIAPHDCLGGEDETGGHITSLTEAVMGMTAGLCRIASAIESIADAIRDHREVRRFAGVYDPNAAKQNPNYGKF